jgi:hypothetical protein
VTFTLNKIDTKKIAANFSERIDAKRAWLDRMANLAAGTPTELTDLNFLCENFLVAIYVEFECLISDLIHGYINNNNKVYMSNIEARIRSSVKDKFSIWHSSNTTFAAPKHLNSGLLTKLLDPTDWNITFKDVAAIQTRAKEWLSPTHQKGFLALSASDIALVDAAHAIRNCIGHNSKSSRETMNVKIKDIVTSAACVNRELGIGANNVSTIGKYLRAATAQGMRVLVYSDRIKAIGVSL